MKKLGKRPLLVGLVLLALMLPLVVVSGGAAVTEDKKVVIDDHQLVFEELQPSGKVDSVKVIDQLALDGNGRVTVVRPMDLEENPKVQGLNGFTVPEVKDGNMTWKDVQVDGPASYVTQNTLTKDSQAPALERMPLDVRFSYWLDGERVNDLKDITGKSGHFRMELYMKNVSKKKETVTYEDSITKQKKTEVTETYMPIVISPYDWYFSNERFFNVKADPTAIIFYLPTASQIGWSIPLFPPATPDTSTTWVEADVKDFAMNPLTLSIAFVYPHTNQTDPIPQFVGGLTSLYGGVQQLSAGMGQMLVGLGSSGISDTLLWGINQLYGGLTQMADASEGLPYAASNVSDQMIPGVETALAGLGGATTPNTLLYGANAITTGLETVQGFFGSATKPDTLLYGTNALATGLQEMQGFIGSPSSSGSLLGGTSTIAEGLTDISVIIGDGSPGLTLQYGANELVGQLQEAKAGLDTLLIPGLQGISGGLSTIADTINTSLQPAATGLVGGLAGVQAYYLAPAIAASASGGSISSKLDAILSSAPSVASLVTECKGLLTTNGDSVYANVVTASNSIGDPLVSPTLRYLAKAVSDGYTGIYATLATGSAGPPVVPPIIGSLDSALIPGLQEMSAGFGDAEDPNTAIGAAALIAGGLGAIYGGIGDTTNPDSLIGGTALLTGGLDALNAGIGSPIAAGTLMYASNGLTAGLTGISQAVGSVNTPDTLLYGSSTIYSGLALMKGSISSGSQSAPGLLEGLEQLGSGLNDAVVGLGSAGNPDSLIGGSAQLSAGMQQLQQGLVTAVTTGTNVMSAGLQDSIKQLNLTQGQLKAIEARGESFDSFIGRVDNPKSKSDVRVLMQTKPVQPKVDNTGMILAIILSILFAVALVVIGSFALRGVSRAGM